MKKSCHNIKMHVSTDKDVLIFFRHSEKGRKHPLEIASDIASKILLPKIVYFIRATLYSASRMPNIEEKNSDQMAQAIVFTTNCTWASRHFATFYTYHRLLFLLLMIWFFIFYYHVWVVFCIPNEHTRITYVCIEIACIWWIYSI